MSIVNPIKRKELYIIEKKLGTWPFKRNCELISIPPYDPKCGMHCDIKDEEKWSFEHGFTHEVEDVINTCYIDIGDVPPMQDILPYLNCERERASDKNMFFRV